MKVHGVLSRPTKLLREKMMGFRALSNRFANARRIGPVPSAVTSEKWDRVELLLR
jgi:hypothetical protein